MKDINIKVTGDYYFKYMTVGKLKTLLEVIPDHLFIAPTCIGNFQIFVNPGNDPIIIINLNSEEIIRTTNNGLSNM